MLKFFSLMTVVLLAGPAAVAFGGMAALAWGDDSVVHLQAFPKDPMTR